MCPVLSGTAFALKKHRFISESLTENGIATFAAPYGTGNRLQSPSHARRVQDSVLR